MVKVKNQKNLFQFGNKNLNSGLNQNESSL
jgi:hypothetical protein